MDEKELATMASIIVSGDVPIEARMQLNTEPSPIDVMVQAAFAARESGAYDSMNREQVLAQLKQNRAEAEAEEE